ncbi:cation-independent mannose-6-phosphate receptor [Microplitis demolitor]|uniref:cation-independent mannose-6-phosphate receptor n=1 Tax=Microplitis demolitor TaxID=69319 RepID=UPI0004CCF8E8|nr:cation-independent mannose-6-phosphate receptor [Microplitis demolitor]
MCRLIIIILLVSECNIGICKEAMRSYCEIDLGVPLLQFDFRKLSDTNRDYVLHHESTNETIKFQLCKPLTTKCNGVDVAGCLLRGKEEIILGRVPDVKHEDGRISFNYIGELCGDKVYYTFNVVMICDFQAENSYPELFPYGQKHCNFYAEWKTKVACGYNFDASIHSVECKVTDNNTKNSYDLGSLKKTSDNYIIPINEKSSIILNICHPVVFGNGVVCPLNSAVCLRNNTNSITYTNIGDVASPEIVNGSLTMTYRTGALCSQSIHSETTISFVCDFKAYETQPALGQLTDDCHYNIIWKTIAACDNKKVEEYKRKTSASCKSINPITNYEYNLDSLKGEDYIVKSDSDEYKFSVCGPLLTNFCKQGNDDSAGVCSAHNRVIGGKANSKLISAPGGLYLNYTDGSSCQGNRSRFTIIAFRCSPEGSDSMPVIVEEKTCHLKIQWNTSLACEKKNLFLNDGETQIREPTIEQSINKIDQSASSLSKIITASTDDKHANGNSYVTAIVIVSVLVGSSIFVAVCFLNSKVQDCVKSCYRCRFLKKSDVRMRYSKISTSSEADALLDGPDTMCQSDSDDDLLRL